MCLCKKCSGMAGGLILIFGIIFLLVDLGIWTFWGIKWWSALLIVAGITICASGSCADCKSCCKIDDKPKSKAKK